MPMPNPEQDELVVDLPSEGAAVSVEIDPSTVAGIDSEVGVALDGTEHDDYSKKVQRRIDKLTKKAREAERQQEAAINYARNIQAENSQLKGRVQDLDQGYVNEYGDRIATQSEALEKDLESAIATNDTAAQVEAQKKLSQLAIEEERVRAAKLQQAQWQQQIAAQQQMAAQQAQQTQPQMPTRVDPKAEDWASKNDWFGDDDAMTFAAFGIHRTLVEDEGFDTESPTYYNELDKRIREAFPHKFSEGVPVTVSEGRRPQQSVASATRSSINGRKTVRLSPSEVAIANKLGVPLDEYAKHKR
jgi:hypothetical protein|tara:strand:+ start:774 stop:1679 length:906 start_codon:yes stop_codon:yes gene_type:complete